MLLWQNPRRHEHIFVHLADQFEVISDKVKLIIRPTQVHPRLGISVPNPWHFGTDPDADPDPRIRTYLTDPVKTTLLLLTWWTWREFPPRCSPWSCPHPCRWCGSSQQRCHGTPTSTNILYMKRYLVNYKLIGKSIYLMSFGAKPVLRIRIRGLFNLWTRDG